MAVFCSAISSLVGGGTSLRVFWAIDILRDICRHGNSVCDAGFCLNEYFEPQRAQRTQSGRRERNKICYHGFE